MRKQLRYVMVFTLFFFLIPLSLQNGFGQQLNISTNKDLPPLLTEVYYYAHPGIQNEFITIYNPSLITLDISGWYITTKPFQPYQEQPKIMFPGHTLFPSRTNITITYNASAYQQETTTLPTYEYGADARSDIPQLTTYKTVHFNNTGGMIALKNTANQTIDLIIYGTTTTTAVGWQGPPVNKSGSGVILKRNRVSNVPVDTNTSKDWKHSRRYGIGQSDFTQTTITGNGEIKTFVSPDSSYNALTSELRNATKSISLNLYEFTDSFLYKELLSVLQRKVSLQIFIEASPVGGMDVREKYILNQLGKNGAQIRFIISDKEHDIYARYTYDHAKYLIIDNTTVIIESCNWAKTGIPKNPSYGNREWGIIIRNPEVANYYQHVFQEDWNSERRDSVPINQMNFSFPSNLIVDESVPKGSYTPQFQSEIIHGSYTITPVLSPDTSEQVIGDAITKAQSSILIEQLYLYKDWGNNLSPFVTRLVQKKQEGVDIKVIVNYNPDFPETNTVLNSTKQFLEQNGIQVKFLYTNWSYFTNLHNKGMIIDNQTVLISSVNWNENSVRRNREVGILVENEEVARYYARVFFYDWSLQSPPKKQSTPGFDIRNMVCISVVFLIVVIVVVFDWKRRKWK